MLSVLAFTMAAAVPLSPEDFLLVLADSSSGRSGAAFWVASASTDIEEAALDTDSMEVLLRDVESISVIPGPPHLLETDEERGSYLVEFPEAEWSWLDDRRRVMRAFGSTRVEMVGGRYYWVELPVFAGGRHISFEHRLLAGFISTMTVLGLSVFVLWWVRRKYVGT